MKVKLHRGTSGSQRQRLTEHWQAYSYSSTHYKWKCPLHAGYQKYLQYLKQKKMESNSLSKLEMCIPSLQAPDYFWSSWLHTKRYLFCGWIQTALPVTVYPSNPSVEKLNSHGEVLYHAHPGKWTNPWRQWRFSGRYFQNGHFSVLSFWETGPTMSWTVIEEEIREIIPKSMSVR